MTQKTLNERIENISNFIKACKARDFPEVSRNSLEDALSIIEEIQAENQKLKEKLEIALNALNRIRNCRLQNDESWIAYETLQKLTQNQPKKIKSGE